MAKNHSVDTSRIQPAQGILVSKDSTKHPALRDMPGSRGSAYAGVPAPTRNQRVTPKRAFRVPGTPDLPTMPVPPASVYQEPPEHVTGSPSDAATPPRG
jgi:hypothetical protein